MHLISKEKSLVCKNSFIEHENTCVLIFSFSFIIFLYEENKVTKMV